MGKGQERVTQINLVLTKRVTSQHPWRIHWNSELGYFIFEILKECPFKVNFYIMFLLTPVSDKLTQEKARWRPSCKRSLICLMFHEGPMCQSAQIWQGASRYQTSTINNCPLYILPSHPERLTERELVDVTTVFHAFESGVRSGTMHQDWLKEVWKYSINIQSNQSKFHYLQLYKAMNMLGLNPNEQEVIDIPNHVARLRWFFSHRMGSKGQNATSYVTK